MRYTTYLQFDGFDMSVSGREFSWNAAKFESARLVEPDQKPGKCERPVVVSFVD